MTAREEKKGFLDPQFSDALAAEIFSSIFFHSLSRHLEWESNKKILFLFIVPLLQTVNFPNFLSLSFMYASSVITYAYRIPSHVHHVREKIVKQHVLFFCFR